MRGLYVCVDEEEGKGGNRGEADTHTHSKRETDRQRYTERETDWLNSLYSPNALLIVFMEIQPTFFFLPFTIKLLSSSNMFFSRNVLRI